MASRGSSDAETMTNLLIPVKFIIITDGVVGNVVESRLATQIGVLNQVPYKRPPSICLTAYGTARLLVTGKREREKQTNISSTVSRVNLQRTGRRVAPYSFHEHDVDQARYAMPARG